MHQSPHAPQKGLSAKRRGFFQSFGLWEWTPKVQMVKESGT